MSKTGVMKCENCKYWTPHRLLEDEQYGICSKSNEEDCSFHFETSKWIPEVKVQLGTKHDFGCVLFSKNGQEQNGQQQNRKD